MTGAFYGPEGVPVSEEGALHHAKQHFLERGRDYAEGVLDTTSALTMRMHQASQNIQVEPGVPDEQVAVAISVAQQGFEFARAGWLFNCRVYLAAFGERHKSDPGDEDQQNPST